jgi:hypothetical protein
VSLTLQIIAGVATGIGFAVLDEVFVTSHEGTIIMLLLDAGLLLVCVVKGRKLPVFLRACASILILYWGYAACLGGRTMEVGLTRTTIGMAITCFIIYGIWPGLVLLRLWTVRTGILLLCVFLPASFLIAHAVASTEEYLFVQKYSDTGVGPTARWTISQHWLAYDKEHRRLDGSD